MLLDLIGIGITFAAVAVGAWFLGGFMVTVFTGGRTFLHPVLRPVEVGFYRLSGIKEDQEQGWVRYTVAMLAVQVVSFIFTYLILRLQDHLPLNPMGFSGVAPDLAWNTTVSFVLISQGVVQSLDPYATAHTVQGSTQTIAVGPFGSQEAIKDLGNNGGGPFNANSAHPFENPNGFTNQFEIFLELLIPFALVVTFGKMVGNIKQGLAIGGAMVAIYLVATGIAIGAEQLGNPALTAVGADQSRTSAQAGGNMEGKGVRFGPVYSANFAV